MLFGFELFYQAGLLRFRQPLECAGLFEFSLGRFRHVLHGPQISTRYHSARSPEFVFNPEMFHSERFDVVPHDRHKNVFDIG